MEMNLAILWIQIPVASLTYHSVVTRSNTYVAFRPTIISSQETQSKLLRERHPDYWSASTATTVRYQIFHPTDLTHLVRHPRVADELANTAGVTPGSAGYNRWDAANDNDNLHV